jgi:hypothetical protein
MKKVQCITKIEIFSKRLCLYSFQGIKNVRFLICKNNGFQESKLQGFEDSRIQCEVSRF